MLAERIEDRHLLLELVEGVRCLTLLVHVLLLLVSLDLSGGSQLAEQGPLQALGAQFVSLLLLLLLLLREFTESAQDVPSKKGFFVVVFGNLHFLHKLLPPRLLFLLLPHLFKLRLPLLLLLFQ